MSLYVESKSDKRIRNTASVTVLILAISAGVLSYHALRELAIKAGIHPMLAFLFPITLDGLILAGSLLILYFAVRGKRSGYGLFLTALGVIVSIAGNVVISPNDITYQILHATSPVVLFLALESLMILLRARSRNAQEAAEKEIAEKKLHEDGYFHHKHQEINPKPLPELPLVSVAQKSPQSRSQPVKASQVVTEASSDKAKSFSTSPEQEKPSESTVNRFISATETKNAETAPSVPLGKHSNKSVIAPTSQEETKPDMQISSLETANSDNGVQPPSKREIIRDLLINDPEMDAGLIVDMVGGDRKYVQKLIRAERTKIQSGM